jgi:Sortase domain/Bacterial Ig-like domain (group 1)
MRKLWLLLVAVLVAATGGACRWGGALAAAGPTASIASVSLSLSPAAVPANGRARSTVVATVSPAIPGLAVRFSTSGDASLSSASAPTDATGHATDVLTASTTPGTQTVTASTVLGSGEATFTQFAIHPVGLVLGSVGIDVPVVAVGLTPSGAMEAPEGPLGDQTWREAFWLRSTSVPGSPGTAAVTGHLDDTAGRPAAFWDLSGLHQGDVVLVVLSDGSRVSFRISDVHVYTVDEASSPAVAARFYGNANDGRAQGLSHLGLMTCTGSFRGSRGFDHRFVAFADRVDG